MELALKVEQGQLNGDIAFTREIVEGVGEIVENGDRLHNDQGDGHWFQKRQDDLKEYLQRACPVDDGGFIKITRNGRDKTAKQKHRKC